MNCTDFEKEFTLKRKLSIQYPISTSVFIWSKDLSLHQQASCRGNKHLGAQGGQGGQLLSPSLPPLPASCCFWGREQREGPEKGSHLTGTISQFLTLGAWWIFKAFFLWSIFVVTQETLCCVPTATPFRWAVSLFQLPFPNPPFPPWCSPHSSVQGSPPPGRLTSWVGTP